VVILPLAREIFPKNVGGIIEKLNFSKDNEAE
jgi:hypothetical protein